jgi:hypothetical protein
VTVSAKLAQVHGVQQLERAVVQLRPANALGFPEMERRAQLALQADAHVFQHRQVREGGRDLERADDAAAAICAGARA